LEVVVQINTDFVQQARNGNEYAIKELYRQYASGMYNLSVRMCGDAEMAKDILQDAFVNAFRNLAQLKDNNSFGGWLKRIVINECIRQTKQSRMFTDFTESLSEKTDDDADWLSTIDMTLVNDEIKKLPNGCRQVFVLYAVEDYSHKDVAETLKISESTSKSQYQRARVLLKERLLKKI
jgi:RNA polymerase sigma-70 factor (ECF subfamily)